MPSLMDRYLANFVSLNLGIVLLATIGFVVWFSAFGGSDTTTEFLGKERSDIYRTLATVASSMLGFSLTATAIIFGLTSQDRVSRLSKHPGFSIVWRVYFQMAMGFGLLVILAFAGILWDDHGNSSSVIRIFVFGTALFVMFRVTEAIAIMKALVTLALSEEPDSGV